MKKTTYKNMWDAGKPVFKGKSIAVHDYGGGEVWNQWLKFLPKEARKRRSRQLNRRKEIKIRDNSIGEKNIF